MENKKNVNRTPQQEGQRTSQRQSDVCDTQNSRDTQRDSQQNHNDPQRRSQNRQQSHKEPRRNVSEQQLQLCFSVTRAKPCSKAGQTGAQACRYAHSLQELQTRIDTFQEAERLATQKKQQAMKIEQQDHSQLLAQMSRLLEERDRANSLLAQRLDSMQQTQSDMFNELVTLRKGILFLGEKLKTLPGVDFNIENSLPLQRQAVADQASATSNISQIEIQNVQQEPQQPINPYLVKNF